MNAYDVMHEWDRATGHDPRTNQDLDREIPSRLSGDYETWKTALEARDVRAIREGMKIWGLPAAPLGDFEMDSDIKGVNRPD